MEDRLRGRWATVEFLGGPLEGRWEDRRGIPEGYVLSPLCFAVYLAPLTIRLEALDVGLVFRNNLRLNHRACVDDLALLGAEARCIRRLLEVVFRWL